MRLTKLFRAQTRHQPPTTPPTTPRWQGSKIQFNLKIVLKFKLEHFTFTMRPCKECTLLLGEVPASNVGHVYGAGSIVRTRTGDRLFSWRATPASASLGGNGALLELWETWPTQEPSSRCRYRALRLDADVLRGGVAVFEAKDDDVTLCVATAVATQRYRISASGSIAVPEDHEPRAFAAADDPDARDAAWSSACRVAIGRADGALIVRSYDSELCLSDGRASVTSKSVSHSGGAGDGGSGGLMGYFSSWVGYGAEAGVATEIIAVAAPPRDSRLAAEPRQKLAFTCSVDAGAPHSLALLAWGTSVAGPPLQRWRLDVGTEIDASLIGAADVAIAVNDLVLDRGATTAARSHGRGGAIPFAVAVAVPCAGRLFVVRGVATLHERYPKVVAVESGSSSDGEGLPLSRNWAPMPRTFMGALPVRPVACRIDDCRHVWCLVAQQSSDASTGGFGAVDADDIIAEDARSEHVMRTAMTGTALHCWDVDANDAGQLVLRRASAPALLEGEQRMWERHELLEDEEQRAASSAFGEDDAAALAATNRFWQHRLFSGARFADAVLADALLHYSERSGGSDVFVTSGAKGERAERAQLEAECSRVVRLAAERESGDERYSVAESHSRAWRQLLRFCTVAWHRHHRPIGLAVPSFAQSSSSAGDGCTPFAAPLIVRDTAVSVLRPALAIENTTLPALRALLRCVATLEARAAPHLLQKCDPLSPATSGGTVESDDGIFVDDVVLKEWVLCVARSAAASAASAADQWRAPALLQGQIENAESSDAAAVVVDIEQSIIAALSVGRSPFAVLCELVAFVDTDRDDDGDGGAAAAATAAEAEAAAYAALAAPGGGGRATDRVWSRALWQVAAARMRAARGAAIMLAYVTHCACSPELRHVLRGVDGGRLFAESLAVLRRCDTMCWLLSRRPDEMARANRLPKSTFYLCLLGTDAAAKDAKELFGEGSLLRWLAESCQISSLAPLAKRLVAATVPGEDAMRRLVRLEACCLLCLARVELSLGAAPGSGGTARAIEMFDEAALLFRQGAPPAGDLKIEAPTQSVWLRTHPAAAGTDDLSAEPLLITAHVARTIAPRREAGVRGARAEGRWRASFGALRDTLARCETQLTQQMRHLATDRMDKDDDVSMMTAAPVRAVAVLRGMWGAQHFSGKWMAQHSGGGVGTFTLTLDAQSNTWSGHFTLASAGACSQVMEEGVTLSMKEGKTKGEPSVIEGAGCNEFGAFKLTGRVVNDTTGEVVCIKRYELPQLKYYSIVTSLFANCGQHAHALAFAHCAIDATAGLYEITAEDEEAATTQPVQASSLPQSSDHDLLLRDIDANVTDTLWCEVFKHANALGQSNDAFSALVQVRDEARREKCQTSFIFDLLHKRSYGWLVHFSFIHWAPHFDEHRGEMISRGFDRAVEDTLLQEALLDFQIEPVRSKDPSLRGRVFKVLYAWHFRRGNLRKAAEAMYQLASCLKDDEGLYSGGGSGGGGAKALHGADAAAAGREEEEEEEEVQLVASCLRRRVDALLAAANAMRLLPSPRLVGYVKKTGAQRDDGAHMMVTVSGVEREVALALARLAAKEGRKAGNAEANDDTDPEANDAVKCELGAMFEVREVKLPPRADADGEPPAVIAVTISPSASDGAGAQQQNATFPLALPPSCRRSGSTVRFVCFRDDRAVAPPLRNWICATSDALWLNLETISQTQPQAQTPVSILNSRLLPSENDLIRSVLATLRDLLLQEQLSEAYELARAFTPPPPAAGAELALVVTQAAARLCAVPGKAHLWISLRAELKSLETSSAAPDFGSNLGYYAHYIAAAKASLEQDSDVALPQWLVDTLVWSSSSSAVDQPPRRPPTAVLIRALLRKGLLIEACEVAGAMLVNAQRNCDSGDAPWVPEGLLNTLLGQCAEVLRPRHFASGEASPHAYRMHHLTCASKYARRFALAFAASLSLPCAFLIHFLLPSPYADLSLRMRATVILSHSLSHTHTHCAHHVVHTLLPPLSTAASTALRRLLAAAS